METADAEGKPAVRSERLLGRGFGLRLVLGGFLEGTIMNELDGEWYRYVKVNYYKYLIDRYTWPKLKPHFKRVVRAMDTKKGFAHAENCIQS